MKIYFAGSIRGGREDAELYLEIINFLRKYGIVLTEHVGNKELKSMGEIKLTERQIHDRDAEWLLSSEVMIAEVSKPSLGVGYEIGIASERGIPVLCLYRQEEGKRLSAMIAGSQKVVNVTYQELEEAKAAIDSFMKELQIKS